jgi:hypothetical protein
MNEKELKKLIDVIESLEQQLNNSKVDERERDRIRKIISEACEELNRFRRG